MDRLEFIVVGIDFSPRSVAAANLAASIARFNESDLVLLHALEHMPSSSQADSMGMTLDELRDTLTSQALNELQMISENINYHKSSIKVVHDNAANALIKECEEHSASLAVVGDTGFASEEAHRMLGSTTHRLLRSFPTKLLVNRPRKRDAILKIAAAVDIEQENIDVIEQARRLAVITGAEVDVVHVCSTEFIQHLYRSASAEYMAQAIAETKEYSAAKLNDLVKQLDWGNIVVNKHVLAGSAGLRLIDFARTRDIDVMVLRATEVKGLAKYFVGSTALQVVEHIPSSVLLIR